MNDCLGNCVTCLKVNHSLFDELNPQELEVLNLDRSRQNYKKGEFIYQEGDVITGLICLNIGKVKTVKKGTIEDEFIMSLHKMVDFIGFHDLMSTSICSTTAIALEDVSVCIIKKEQFEAVIKTNNFLALKIIAHQSSLLIEQQAKLLNIAQHNLDARLAFALIQLIEFYGYERDGVTLSVTIKRKELAAMSSMNTANAIRTLSKFNNNGWISIEKKAISILDKDQLTSLL